MTSNGLRRKLPTSGGKPTTGIWLHCDDNQFDHYCSLIREVCPEWKIERGTDTPSGKHRVRGRAALTVNDHYFRALAKIGFHYCLAHTQRGFKGNEAFFRPLRSFIMDGGKHEPFVSEGSHRFGPTVDNWLRSLVSLDWFCHVLTLDESGSTPRAYVHLFRTGRYHAPGYQIILGRSDASIEVPALKLAHVYTYDNPQPQEGYAGDVREIPVTA